MIVSPFNGNISNNRYCALSKCGKSAFILPETWKSRSCLLKELPDQRPTLFKGPCWEPLLVHVASFNLQARVVPVALVVSEGTACFEATKNRLK